MASNNQIKKVQKKTKERRNATSIKVPLKNTIQEMCYSMWVHNLGKEFERDVPYWLYEDFMFHRGSALIFRFAEHWFLTNYCRKGQINTQGRLVKVSPVCVGLGADKLNSLEFTIEPYIDEVGVFHEPDAVIVYNTMPSRMYPFGKPTWVDIKPYIERMDYAWQSVGIAEANSRVKTLYITQDPKTADAINEEIAELTDNVLNCMSVASKLAPQTEILGGTTQGLISEAWNDYFTAKNEVRMKCGIKTGNNIEKKERMNNAEINSNNDAVELVLANKYEARRKAYEDLKRVFKEEGGIPADAEPLSYWDKLEKEEQEKLEKEQSENEAFDNNEEVE